MVRYILGKLGWFLVTLFAIIVLVFFMVRMTGIDPCNMPKATPQIIEACRANKGLDKPVIVQLGVYLNDMVRFDLGKSYQNEGYLVTDIIAQSLPNTLKLISLALPIALMLGIFIGVVAAVNRNTKLDYRLTGVALVGVAIPEFVIGPVLILFFSMKLGWVDRTQGLPTVGSYILPVLTLVLPLTAAIARLARVGMLEILSQDYVRTARAKGVAEFRVIVRHTLRLGLTPVISYIGPVIAGMIAGGSFIVETIFGIPGVGKFFVEAAVASPIDFPMIMGSTIVLATLILTMNFLVDITYAMLDPRQRSAHKSTFLGKTSLLSYAKMLGVFVLVLASLSALIQWGSAYTKQVTDWLSSTKDRANWTIPMLSVLWVGLGAWLVVTYRRAMQSKGKPGTRPLYEAVQRIAKHRAGVVSICVLYGICLACIAGPWMLELVTTFDYQTQDRPNGRLAPPFMAWFGVQRVAGWDHLFGTDSNGRDLLARTLMGGRVSLSIAFAALVVSTSIGVLYGTYAAYVGGRVETIMMRVVDILYSIPYMILVILLVAFLGRSILLLFIAIGCVSWLTLARITRGQVLKVKNLEYVQVAQVSGASTWRIIRRHLIPNAIGPIIIYATRLVALIVLEEAFLSFIGIGVQEPMASWGILIQNGNKVKEYYWWMLAFPGLFLAVTLYCLNYAGDGLRDALDPSLKGVD